MFKPISCAPSDEFIKGECSKTIDKYDGPLDVVVDVGAHVGFFTFAAINKGAGEVWAFEPQPQNYAKLVENLVHANLLGRVIPLPLALSDANGALIPLGKAGLNNGQNGLMMQDKMESPYVARCVALEDFHLLINKGIDYMKVDTEGAEYLIFKDRLFSQFFLAHVGYLEIELHDPATYIEMDSEKIPSVFRADPVNLLIEMLQDFGFSENAAEAKTLKRVASHNLRRSA